MIFMFLIVFILFIGLILVLLNTITLNRSSERKYRYQRKEYFMTRHESDFYKALVEAIGAEYFIFAQVHLSSILDERIKGENWKAARAHINRKSIDFLLCDKETISPKLAIELDDWSHARADRKVRDVVVEEILAEVGLPLFRTTNTENLREGIRNALHPQQKS